MPEANTNTASARRSGSDRVASAASDVTRGVKATASQIADSAAAVAATNERSAVRHANAPRTAPITTAGPWSPQYEPTARKPRLSTLTPASAPTAAPTRRESDGLMGEPPICEARGG